MSQYPVYEGFHVVNQYDIPENLHNLINDWFDKQRPIIELGISSDHVLSLMPKILMIGDPKVLGHDANGLVVEWYYEGLIITMARVFGHEMETYCVQQIQVQNDNN